MGLSSPITWDDLHAATHVWCAFTDALPTGWEERCFDWLTLNERAQHGRLATVALQQSYLAMRALCRATLSRYTGVKPAAWVFATGEHGKPTIVEPAGFSSLRFNLSRTRGLSACAVTCAGEIGVDVEETTRKIDVARIAWHFFSTAEQAAMAAQPPTRRTAWFFEHWTLKEAYLKGLGTGLSEPPEEFSIERGLDGAPTSLGEWRLSLHHPSPRHVASVAVSAPIPVLWFKAETF